MMKFDTIILTLNTPTLSGRIYTKEVIEEALSRLNGRELLGTYGGNGNSIPMIDLTAVSHSAQDIRLEDDKVVCTINVLETPNGKKLQGALEVAKFLPENSVRFAPSGSGIVNEDGSITDYTISSVDAFLANSL